MARVIFGTGISEINGKVGGSVYQKNAYGFTVKNSPNMVRPNSNAVFDRQNQLRRIVQLWSAISESQRAEFNDYAIAFPQYAKHNPSAQLSGYNIFCRWNLIRLLNNEDVQLTTELLSTTFGTVAPSLDRDGSNLLLSLNDTGSSADVWWSCSISNVLSAGVYYKTSGYRHIAPIEAVTVSTNINALYLAIFGRLPDLGSYVFVKVVPFSFDFPKIGAESFYRVLVA